jgi:hypothetical protein
LHIHNHRAENLSQQLFYQAQIMGVLAFRDYSGTDYFHVDLVFAEGAITFLLLGFKSVYPYGRHDGRIQI